MAVEPRRGCGFRKVGGLYLASGGRGVFCDRLPIVLEVCPTCGHGVKQSRGWTWVDAAALVGGVHPQCLDDFRCPLCMAPEELGRCWLLWVGEQFYKTPAAFDREAMGIGISRRISAIPRGFKTGETWILLAHRKAVATQFNCPKCCELLTVRRDDGVSQLVCRCGWTGPVYRPGIFKVWRPERIEKILPESLRGVESCGGHAVQCDGPFHDGECTFADCPVDLARKGIAPVYVPDDDPDHRGTVYDDEEGNSE